jgi:hypothetical protein
MQRYRVSLYLETALHVPGGTYTYHQERIQLYLQHLVFFTQLRHPQHTETGPNSSTIAADSSNGVTNPDAVDTVVYAPDDEWKCHPKHVERFPSIKELCNIASCWIYIGIYLRCTDP